MSKLDIKGSEQTNRLMQIGSSSHTSRRQPKAVGLPPLSQPRILTPTLQGLILAFSLAFLLSALVGVWAAFDRQEAWFRFALLAVAVAIMLAIWIVGWRFGESGLGWLALACAAGAGLRSLYFLLAFDFVAHSGGRFALFQPIGNWIQTHRASLAIPEDLYPNITAATLAILVALGWGGVAWAWQQGHRALAVLAGLILALSVITLLLTMSRGALLGMAGGVLIGAYLAWRNRPQRPTPLLRLGDGLLVLVPGLAIMAFWAMSSWPQVPDLLTDLQLGSDLAGRAALWRQGLDLVGDYPFTGSGLGSTLMVHATYVLLIHVGFLPHMHNLYLEIAIEQGLPGLIAFLGLAVLALYALWSYGKQHRASAIYLATIIALSAQLLHGVFDAGVYTAWAAFLLLLPMGFAFGLGSTPGAGTRAGTVARKQRPWLWPVVALALMILLNLILLLPTTRSLIHSNLGTVQQTRLELSRYTWPEDGIQDAVRRDALSELTPAMERYRAALALDPNNLAAQRRLGQIELALGNYEAAGQYLERAYALAPDQRATRHMLGELYAIAGNTDAAATLWDTVSGRYWWEVYWVGPDSFQGRVWWHAHNGETEIAQRLEEVMALVGE